MSPRHAHGSSLPRVPSEKAGLKSVLRLGSKEERARELCRSHGVSAGSTQPAGHFAPRLGQSVQTFLPVQCRGGGIVGVIRRLWVEARDATKRFKEHTEYSPTAESCVAQMSAPAQHL